MQATTKGEEWWRWPLMPLAALGGGFIGSYLFTILQYAAMKFQGGFTEDGWMLAYVLPLISSATFGYLFAYISCTFSPKAKFTAGVAMTSVLGVFMALLAGFIWTQDYPTGRAVFETCKIGAVMAAAIAALLHQRDEIRMKEMRGW